jgi:NDP-sugar pyrophosphorylase family protein
VIGVAYLKEKIIEYFKKADLGVDITYSAHTVEGGTGEGFRLAISRYVNCDDFFALNGDQITDLNLQKMAKFHAKHKPLVTLAVINPHCPFGEVLSNDYNDVVSFKEKPLCKFTHCNSGIYIFNHDILNYLPKNGDIEKETFPPLATARRIKSFHWEGFFTTVNTYKDITDTEERMREK